MAIKIRLTRGGSKKRPFYRVVAADSRMPRDGRFIEKLGTYNPLLSKDDPNRVNLNIDKIKDWLKKGAQVSDRISRLLENLSVLENKKRNNPNKGKKHKATLEREASKSEKQTKLENKNSDVKDENKDKPLKEDNSTQTGKEVEDKKTKEDGIENIESSSDNSSEEVSTNVISGDESVAEDHPNLDKEKNKNSKEQVIQNLDNDKKVDSSPKAEEHDEKK